LLPGLEVQHVKLRVRSPIFTLLRPPGLRRVRPTCSRVQQLPREAAAAPPKTLEKKKDSESGEELRLMSVKGKRNARLTPNMHHSCALLLKAYSDHGWGGWRMLSSYGGTVTCMRRP
jgi:hypothetical protein